jgi:hypothetical protein
MLDNWKPVEGDKDRYECLRCGNKVWVRVLRVHEDLCPQRTASINGDAEVS